MIPTRFRFALAVAVVAIGGSVALADAIYLFNPDGSPRLTPYWENVTILRSKDKSLVFRTGSGTESNIEFEKIARITVGADPILSDGDDAYVLGNFESAVDAYLKAIRTNEGWKVTYITPRLAKSAEKTRRFDAALAAYIGYAQTDPPAAIANKPTLPAKGSKLLDEAAKQLETATRAVSDNGVRQALLSLTLDVQMARGDQAAAEATANQLTSLSGDQSDPRVAAMLVGIKLDQAAVEVAAGRFERVGPLINPVRSKLTEPAQQARALFLLAQASRGSAGNDKTKLLDAAIAFMRVAAHFDRVDGRPLVGESLLEAARINRDIDDVKAARMLLDQIDSEFTDTPIAQQATILRKQLSQ